jgi:hypothetical protein
MYYIKQRGRRKLHNKQLHNFYSPPDIIRVIKAKSMRWTGHVAHLGLDEKFALHFCHKS